MAVCSTFKKESRGRPSLNLPCSLCGVIYKDHGKTQVAPAARVIAPAPRAIPSPAPIIQPIQQIIPVAAPSKPRDISHLLALFPEQTTTDW